MAPRATVPYSDRKRTARLVRIQRPGLEIGEGSDPTLRGDRLETASCLVCRETGNMGTGTHVTLTVPLETDTCRSTI